MSKFFKGGKYVYEKLVPKVAKDLTGRRKTFEEMRDTVDKVYNEYGVKIGESGKTAKRKAIIKGSQIHDKYDKSVKATAKKFKSQKRKAIGGASAAVVGATAAHGVAKKKFPKYKKFMESEVVIKKKK